MSQTIVIFGGTGSQGGAIINELLSQNNYTIRTFTTNPNSEKAQSLREKGVQVFEADVHDLSSLKPVYENADAAYINAATDYHVIKQQIENQVCKEAGVQHVIFSTYGGEISSLMSEEDCPKIDGYFVPLLSHSSTGLIGMTRSSK